MIHIESPRTLKLLELIRQFIKGTGFMFNTQNSCIVLNATNENLEIEILKIQFTIASINMNYFIIQYLLSFIIYYLTKYMH